MDTSIWQDEAQLANMFLEEESNRSSSESSSPGFHFKSTLNLKKNLTATFDNEVPDLPALPVNANVDNFGSNDCAAKFSTTRSADQPASWSRPPLPAGIPLRSKPRKSKKNFSVYLRIRPLSPNVPNDIPPTKEKGPSTIEILKPLSDSKNQTSFPTTIRTYPPNISNTYRMNINRQSRDNSAYAKEFNFDRVIGPETSQESVYATVAAPLINDLLNPHNEPSSARRTRHKSALLFSYGITNAGKTHTILGDMNSTNQADWGIIPRTISDIFQQTRINSDSRDAAIRSFQSSNKSFNQKPPCNLYISFFEIYNENVFDLMPTAESTSSKYPNYSPPALKVRECRGQIFVRGLAKHRISTVAQGIELTKQAHKKRHTSSNNLNSDSSRSHFICQIQIVPQMQPVRSVSDRELMGKSKMERNFSSEDTMSGYSTDEEATARSRLSASTIWVVDLAGSERSKRTQIGGTRQKESTKINNSLMTLMRCLNAMKKDGKKGHGKNVIPFRDSKLTHIFMGHLTSESAAQTAMMVNVNPSVEDFDETQHVLAYSRKAKLIEIDMKEYSMKRKEFFGEEYDQNGRKKPRLGEKKRPPDDMVSKKPKSTLMSRIAKKFSPKKCVQNTNVSDKVEKYNGGNGRNVGRTEEIETLEKSLQQATEKVAILENHKSQLLDELDRKEEQIRIEVSMEMEKRLRETRTKHNEKYEQLRSEMRRQASKADISVSMNRAGTQLEELMDKIDECEKEMIRMSQEHQKTVTALNNQIECLKTKAKLAAKEKANDNIKISKLEEALKKSNEEMMELKRVQVGDKRERDAETSSKDIQIENSMKFKRKLRPRKPFGNSTNQTMGSRVFAIDEM